jgi:NADH:ubiquinone oxidoreductase subunit 3 (subunit A)
MISAILSVLLVSISYYGIPRVKSAEKLSAYECGFEPFPEGKYLFDVHFYVLALLFLIFDVEIVLLTS